MSQLDPKDLQKAAFGHEMTTVNSIARPSVDSKLSELSVARSELNNTLGALYDRLSPVLRPIYTEEGEVSNPDATPERSTSLVVEALDSEVSQILAMQRGLLTLLDRIDL